MIFGGLLNIFLDWLFIVVIPWGLTGAAIATMLSQAATSILCLQHFFSDKSSLRIHWDSLKLNTCLQILKLGTSSLLMYMYLSVVLILHNKAFLMVGKPIHVAAYGIVSYTEAFFYLIFEGIALGTQPITSFNTGAGLIDRVIKVRNLAFAVTLTVAFIGVTILYSLPDYVVYLFAGDNQLLQPDAINGMHLYFWGLPFEGLLLIGATYFQSINMAKEASILTGGKLILISIFIFTFAHIFGVDGVWVALPFCSLLLTSWMICKLKRL